MPENAMAERNGWRLHTAAMEYQNTRGMVNPVDVPVLNYDDQDPDLTLNICRGSDFFGLPALV